MKVQSASGQILVLVLLVVLVGMTVGLSVASRTFTTIRNQSDLTNSNRAFSVAEAGIEQALLQLKDGGDCGGDGSLCRPDIDGVEAKVHIDTAGGPNSGGTSYGIASLPRDEVFQLNLQGYDASANTVDLYWGVNGDRSNCAQSAAVVVSLIYQRSGQYGLSKQTIDPCKGGAGNQSRTNNGFSTDASENPPNQLTLQDGTKESGYGYKKTIRLRNVADSMADSGDVLISLRVKLLYAGQKPVAYAPEAGVNLPVQGQQITSTAAVGGQQRTVKVLRSSDTVPAIFDYALFNGSTSTLSKTIDD